MSSVRRPAKICINANTLLGKGKCALKNKPIMVWFFAPLFKAAFLFVLLKN